MRRRLVVVNVAGLRNERVSAEYNAFMTHRLRHLMRVTAISSKTSNICDDFFTSIKSIVGVAAPEDSPRASASTPKCDSRKCD